jgi:hypothetical protein
LSAHIPNLCSHHPTPKPDMESSRPNTPTQSLHMKDDDSSLSGWRTAGRIFRRKAAEKPKNQRLIVSDNAPKDPEPATLDIPCPTPVQSINENSDRRDQNPSPPIKLSRRQDAENQFKAAVEVLDKAISNSSRRLQLPEELRPSSFAQSINVEETARNLEISITKFIDERANSAQSHVWKICIKRWFRAMFPYAQICLNAIVRKSLS